jgi:hypothetical protein
MKNSSQICVRYAHNDGGRMIYRRLLNYFIAAHAAAVYQAIQINL